MAAFERQTTFTRDASQMKLRCCDDRCISRQQLATAASARVQAEMTTPTRLSLVDAIGLRKLLWQGLATSIAARWFVHLCYQLSHELPPTATGLP